MIKKPDLAKNIEYKKVYLCEECTYEANSKEEFKNHIHCVQCGSVHKNMEDLVTHLQSVHVNDVIAVCDKKCNQSFKVINDEGKRLHKTISDNVTEIKSVHYNAIEKDVL